MRLAAASGGLATNRSQELGLWLLDNRPNFRDEPLLLKLPLFWDEV
jgi:hypothetical protein